MLAVKALASRTLHLCRLELLDRCMEVKRCLWALSFVIGLNMGPVKCFVVLPAVIKQSDRLQKCVLTPKNRQKPIRLTELATEAAAILAPYIPFTALILEVKDPSNEIRL